MHAFLWPKEIKPEPRGVARLGRVLHWVITAGALLVMIGCAYTYLTGEEWERQSALAGLVAGAGLFIVGRAARYIFAGE